MSKFEQLDKLFLEYRNQFQEKEIVLSAGNEHAQIMLIGEAPGKEEVRLSKPFVGAAGKNLNEFISVLGIQRESLYITNAIKHRLSKINSKTGQIINRPATKEEIKENREYLMREIDIVNPKVIVTLGNVPLKSVTDDYSISIGDVHGEMRDLDIFEKKYWLFPLYHPASIIYNASLKDIYQSDLDTLKELIKKI